MDPTRPPRRRLAWGSAEWDEAPGRLTSAMKERTSAFARSRTVSVLSPPTTREAAVISAVSNLRETKKKRCHHWAPLLPQAVVTLRRSAFVGRAVPR